MTRCLPVLLVLSAACSHSIYVQKFSASDLVTHDFSAMQAPEVDVTTFNGHVDVKQSADSAVHVSVTKRVNVGSQAEAPAALANIDVAFATAGRRLQVTARRKTERFMESPSADVELQVPKEASLVLATSNGAVDVHDVGISVKADTSNGTITLNGTRGPIDATTTNGNITLAPASPVVAKATTSNGAIGFAGPLAPGPSHFSTSNGAIDISLPATSQFEIDARTSLGNVTSDFPMTTTASADHELRGYVGGVPRAQIEAHTSLGSIRVHSR